MTTETDAELVAFLRKEARCRADELNFDDVDAFHMHQLTWIAADRIEALAAKLVSAERDAERYKGALDTAAWMLERWEGAFASSAPTLSHETINFLLSLSAYAARVQERSDGKE